MSFRKYQKVESATVATPSETQKIGAAIRQTGKSSVREMTQDEKRALLGEMDADHTRRSTAPNGVDAR
jgi:hypothetical protein